MIHGKQIKDNSILLNKLNPVSGQTLTLLGTTKIQQNAAPTTGIDLVNKEYVDALVTGLDFKNSCIVATIVNIDISNAPATIDGITVSNGGRVLVKNQTNAQENGIYIYNGVGNAMTRATDADNNPSGEVTGGMFVFIETGTWADTGWVLATNDPIILDTTLLTFVQFSAAGVITADNGLTKTVNNIQLGGQLLQDTTINGDNGTHALDIINLENMFISSVGLNSFIQLYSNNTSSNIETSLALTTTDIQLFATNNTTNINSGLIFNPSTSSYIEYNDMISNNRKSYLQLESQLATLTFEDNTNNLLSKLIVGNVGTTLLSSDTSTSNETIINMSNNDITLFNNHVINNKNSSLYLGNNYSSFNFQNNASNIESRLFLDDSNFNLSINELSTTGTNLLCTTTGFLLQTDDISNLLATKIQSINANTLTMSLSDNNISQSSSITIFHVGEMLSGGDPSTDNRMVVVDRIGNKGLVYDDDYSANFTNNSLVTKEYVDLNGGGVDTQSNKNMTALVATATGQQIAAAITTAPRNDSYVQVYINGVKVVVGDAVNTGDVYFADPGSLSTPKNISDITVGDVLVRGAILGYDTDASDIVEYDYQV